MKFAFISNIYPRVRNQRRRFLTWVDAFWGYDVFIAHRRGDAAEYARRLYELLQAKRISCFIDQKVYGAGDYLTVATRRHVAKSSVFVLLGSPEILTLRKPKDWVEEEINEYLASHESDPKVVPIDFGETIVKALPSATNPILGKVENFLRIAEPLSALAATPSDAVLDPIRKKLEGRRRDKLRVRFFQIAAGVLAILLIFAVLVAAYAWNRQQAATANEQAAKANESRALAALSKVTQPTDPALATKLALAAWPRSGADPRRKLDPAIAALSAAVPELRERKILRDHRDRVWSAAFSPDGARVVTASDDKTARIWDVATGKAIAVLSGHSQVVTSAAFSPDGERVVTASEDNTARLWDAKTGAAIAVLRGHSSAVRSPAFSPDGARVVTASWDRTARIWDVSAIPQGNVFQIACAWLPDHDLTGVAENYGLTNLDPICEGDPPPPDRLPE